MIIHPRDVEELPAGFAGTLQQARTVWSDQFGLLPNSTSTATWIERYRVVTFPAKVIRATNLKRPLTELSRL